MCDKSLYSSTAIYYASYIANPSGYSKNDRRQRWVHPRVCDSLALAVS